MARVAPHEISWLQLEVVAKRGPHPPEAMRSAQSTGPIRCFVCDHCRNRIWLYHPLDPTPTCAGSRRAILQGSDD